jgi:enolase-phosphatase E1
MSAIKCILTDIEGTTSSVSFVYDVLFPYFRAHIHEAKDLNANQINPIFTATKEQAAKEGIVINSIDECLELLKTWSLEDRKFAPLKTLQGYIWQKGYESGKIKGHVYEDVLDALDEWAEDDLILAVYSSGSVQAQKLIFGYSERGDLTPYFSYYFDTKMGGKKEARSYENIAQEMDLEPYEVLFLSDVPEELRAAREAGMEVVQLVREGTKPSPHFDNVDDFSQITY